MNIRFKTMSAAVLLYLFSTAATAQQEVLNGSYSCEADAFDSGVVLLTTELSATSGITAGLNETSAIFRELPANLAALLQACEENVESVIPLVPKICWTGPVARGFARNLDGESVFFDFTCLADKDQIINAISVMSRIPLSIEMP